MLATLHSILNPVDFWFGFSLGAIAMFIVLMVCIALFSWARKQQKKVGLYRRAQQMRDERRFS